MQDKENEYPTIVGVEFNRRIKIRGSREKVIAAEYTGGNCSGKILLISNNDSVTPKENELYLVFLPRKGYYSNIYYNGINVFRVRTVMPETIGEIKVFKNIFIPDSEFKKLSNGKIAVIIADPKGEHGTSLLRILVNNGNGIVERFVKKNLLLEHMRVKKSGVIEATVKLSEDSTYLKNDFLKHLSELSEA